MWLCGLLLSLSMVLSHTNGNYTCDSCNKDNSPETSTMTHHTYSSLSDFPCFIYNANLLSCSWSTDSLPEDTQYSATYQHCMKSEDYPLKCTSESSSKKVECQGRANITMLYDDDLLVKVSISSNDSQYIVCQIFSPVYIEKLDPPQNVSTLINSGKFEIHWTPPQSCCAENDCFTYELKINDESVHYLESELHYNKEDFDPTTRYTIQIRVKISDVCGGQEHWSEWSKPVVVSPTEKPSQLNVRVIVCIAFVLPMILLALLLVCKFQRVFDKLFPSIPDPDKNVRKLLEKNDFSQVTPPKQCEERVEIIEVIG